MTELLIYDENAGTPNEWDADFDGTSWQLGSTLNPFQGNACIEATSLHVDAFVHFDAAAPVDTSPWNALRFYLRSKAEWVHGRGLNIQFTRLGLLVGTEVFLGHAFFDFNSADAADYQTITIPLADFQLNGADVDQLIMLRAGESTRGAIGFWLDKVLLTDEGIGGGGGGGDCDCCPDEVLGEGNPPLVPPGPVTGSCMAPAIDNPNGPFALTWSRDNLDAAGYSYERHAYAYYATYLRPAAAGEQTTLDLSEFGLTGLALDHLHVYAINGSNARIATATITGTDAVFAPASPLLVAGFEIELDANADTDFSFAQGLAINIWGPSSLDADGDSLAPLVAGSYYWVEFNGGNWRHPSAITTPRTDYIFSDDGGSTWVGHLGNDGSIQHLEFEDPILEVTDDGGFDWGHYVFRFAGGTFRQRVYIYNAGNWDNVPLTTELFNASVSGARQVDLVASDLFNICGV